MEVRTEFYVAPVDGARCLRVTGRARRRTLPVAATRPDDVEPSRCFLCHPENDPLDRGGWPSDAPLVRVLGNAFPVAHRSLLVAPTGPEHHTVSPADLAVGPILRLVMDADFVHEFGLDGSELSLFWNVGTLAGQSRRHPHAQVVGLPEHLTTGTSTDAIRQDLASASEQGRWIGLGAAAGGSGDRPAAAERLGLVIPARPSMTAEAWLPIQVRTDANAAAQFDHAVAHLVRAVERHISGNYNLVLLPAANILRVIPRGISERAGLEFAFPGAIDNVVATSVPESLEIWRAALDAAR